MERVRIKTGGTVEKRILEPSANLITGKGKNMGKKKLTDSYEELPRIVKIILQIFFGGVIGGVYRIIRYTETNKTLTLVVGLIFLLTGVGNFIAWLVDLITEVTSNRITVLAD